MDVFDGKRITDAEVDHREDEVVRQRQRKARDSGAVKLRVAASIGRDLRMDVLEARDILRWANEHRPTQCEGQEARGEGNCHGGWLRPRNSDARADHTSKVNGPNH